MSAPDAGNSLALGGVAGLVVEGEEVAIEQEVDGGGGGDSEGPAAAAAARNAGVRGLRGR
jgi:hypothetical protein